MPWNEDILPRTTHRVAKHTADRVNRSIEQRTEANVAYFAEHADEIDDRLGELDREWDIERTLEANASTLALTGTVLGAALNRRFLWLPGLVTAFLLQHALQGWCPPVAVFRRMGVRTAAEIAHERYALKYLRGDFGDQAADDMFTASRARYALAAADPR